MLKEDFKKIKKVITHRDNKREHIRPIHKLIGLFKNKWKGNFLIEECYNQLINLEKELIGKLNETNQNTITKPTY